MSGEDSGKLIDEQFPICVDDGLPSLRDRPLDQFADDPRLSSSRWRGQADFLFASKDTPWHFTNGVLLMWPHRGQDYAFCHASQASMRSLIFEWVDFHPGCFWCPKACARSFRSLVSLPIMSSTLRSSNFNRPDLGSLGLPLVGLLSFAFSRKAKHSRHMDLGPFFVQFGQKIPVATWDFVTVASPDRTLAFASGFSSSRPL